MAYYLAALLREERAAGQERIVTSVAVQQAGHGHPMDDVIAEFRNLAGTHVSDLQVTRHLRISAASTNNEFREIVAAAVATRNSAVFRENMYANGFAVEHVAAEPFRSFNRLVDGRNQVLQLKTSCADLQRGCGRSGRARTAA